MNTPPRFWMTFDTAIFGVVVGDPLRHAAEKLERPAMALLETSPCIRGETTWQKRASLKGNVITKNAIFRSCPR